MIEMDLTTDAATRKPLPEGWRWVPLGEVCELNPPRPNIQRADDQPTSFIPMAAVNDEGRGLAEVKIRLYGEVRKGYTYFASGDVLFAKITPCMQNGKIAVADGLIDDMGFGSTEFHVLRPSESVLAQWLQLFLQQNVFLRDAATHMTGTVGQQRLPGQYLAQVHLPIPPISDQKRIIAILRDELAAVERARAAAEAELATAKELPAAYLRAVFESDEAREWPNLPLGEVATVTGGIQRTPNRKPREFHRPYLTVRNVQRGALNLTNVERFEVTPEELAQYRLVAGDLLIVEGNGSPDQIGRNAVFAGEIDECVHQNHIIRARCNQSQCQPEFVSLYLNSDAGKTQMLDKAMTTTGLFTLSVTKVERLMIPVPHLDKQEACTRMLNGRLADARHLQVSLDAQIRAINALPSALLRRAFNGEL